MHIHHNQGSIGPRSGQLSDTPVQGQPHQDQKDAVIHALLDLSPLPITVTRCEDGRFMLINQRFSEIIGHSPRQILGRTPQELHIDAEVSNRDRLLSLLQLHDRVEKFETQLVTRNHRVVNVQLSARKIFFENQACILSIITDFEKQSSTAPQRLSKAESRYHNILNSITESYYEVDLSGRFTFMSDAAVDLFGYPADQLVGMSYQDYTTPENAKIAFEAFFKVYQGIVPVIIAEYSIIRGDGTIAHLEVSASLLRDEAGNPIGFYGINRDRTEQRKAQEALRRSEEKYRTVLENMTEGYYEVDLNGNYTAFNEATCRLLEYSADELMGLNYSKYLTTEDAETHRRIYIQMRKTGQPAELIDANIIRRDKTCRSAEISAHPMKNPDGEIIGFWGLSRDRTEQKRAEMALQKSEEKYRLLVDHASDGIYINQSGRIRFNNPKTSKITGYLQDELENMSFAELVHPEDRKTVYEVQQHKLETGQIPEVFSFRILNKEQQAVWVELSAIGITWEGQPAALNFLRDVTHMKKTEARLQQAQKMEAVGTLAGGIAHDFNNILYGILGFTELALEDAPQGSLLEDNLGEVVKASIRAKELVRQILAFARQSEEKVEPIIVSPIVKEALKLIRSSIPSTIEIQSDIASHAPTLGNPTQMHQIIMNLCTNAAHAMEQSGGTLSVSLVELHVDQEDPEGQVNLTEGDYLKLTVSDTGCGIAPDIIHAIFEPYFTTKPMGEGTGMGLSVVQGIVEHHGGKITVQSALGWGSTFSVYLPISGGVTPAMAETVRELPADSERILFVDDEPSLVKMGGRILEGLGYRVTTQTSSLEALKLFRARPEDFDLVMIDMTMPQMTGDHLAGELMRIRPDIPVIVCTGYSKKMNEELAAQIGIKAFIYKPLKKKEIAAAIRKVLDENLQHRNGSTIT